MKQRGKKNKRWTRIFSAYKVCRQETKIYRISLKPVIAESARLVSSECECP